MFSDGASMLEQTDAATFDDRIEALTAALESSTDAHTRGMVKELLTLVLDLHKRGLRQFVAAVDRNDAAKRQLLENPVVRSLLALHDLEFSPVLPLIQISRRPAVSADTDPADAPAHVMRCAKCRAPLQSEHRHIVDVQTRRLSCCCRACWLLAGSDVPSSAARPVPDRYRHMSPTRLTAPQWDALAIPVDLAFLMVNSVAGRTIAFYPGPAGPTESALSLERWQELVEANPWIRAMSADVEALLVRRDPHNGTCEGFIVPIDACYELVGRIRVAWTGLGGGAAVRREVDAFFAGVVAKSGAGRIR
jgi:hypothetical protein